MVLEDKIIVTEEDLDLLYFHARPKRKAISYVVDLGLLPLTVKSLTTTQGRTFLEYVTWVYFSGFIGKPYFCPVVCKSREKLETLIEPLIANLGIRVRYDKNSLFLAEYSGIIGRLLCAMGIPKVEGKAQRGRVTKPTYRNKTLPHYFWDIESAKPLDEEEKNQKVTLLNKMCDILWKDRLGRFGNGVYLRLNSFMDSSDAKSYAEEVIHFLNKVYKVGRKGLFDEDQARVWSHNQAYESRFMSVIIMNSNQIYNLINRGALRIKVNYPT